MIETEDYLEVAARYDHPQDAYLEAVRLDGEFPADVLTGLAFFVHPDGNTIMILSFPRQYREAARRAQEMLGEAVCPDEDQPTAEECLDALEAGQFALACAGPLETFGLAIRFLGGTNA